MEISASEGDTVVVCGDTGCNETQTTNSESKDVISDVVVHVKTSVNVPTKNTTIIEETPDVPVILGYGNSNPQITPIDNLGKQSPVPGVPRFPQHRRKYLPPKQVSLNSQPSYVPYLENSFHKYSFGEQPPLQYVWTPVDGGTSFNPVEFKRFEKPSTWNRVQWNDNRPAGVSPTYGVDTSKYTTCTCHNPGLNWYPTTPMWRVGTRNLNPHIDDKLGPLN